MPRVREREKESHIHTSSLSNSETSGLPMVKSCNGLAQSEASGFDIAFIWRGQRKKLFLLFIVSLFLFSPSFQISFMRSEKRKKGKNKKLC